MQFHKATIDHRKSKAYSINVSVLKLILVGFIGFSAVGCGSGLASVNGLVTLDGNKLKVSEGESATIVFQPEGGSGAIGTSSVDESSRYKIRTGNAKGVEPGVYLVSVSIIKKTPSADPNSPPSRKRLSSSRYANVTTSGLKFEIPPGGKQINLEVTSD